MIPKKHCLKTIIFETIFFEILCSRLRIQPIWIISHFKDEILRFAQDKRPSPNRRFGMSRSLIHQIICSLSLS